eukprot:TRINITY_DN15045_c0_g1_i1.p1 TRINITY_DN15045_c0_g1~~TRINITY_DN15045_c0_g1_i1.p1  ORF type:complete len:231 (+),score=74.50 TRINITY_DN15045_c0_g1_i1:84-776(+)
MERDDELSLQVFRQHVVLNQKVVEEHDVRLFSFGYGLFECPPNWSPVEHLAPDHALIESQREGVKEVSSLLRVPLDDLGLDGDRVRAAAERLRESLRGDGAPDVYGAKVVPGCAFCITPHSGDGPVPSLRSNRRSVEALCSTLRMLLADGARGDCTGGVAEDAVSSHSTVGTAAHVGCVGDVCCVCLADMHETEEVRRLRCRHSYHRCCIDRWLTVGSFCPACKQSVLPH